MKVKIVNLGDILLIPENGGEEQMVESLPAKLQVEKTPFGVHLRIPVKFKENGEYAVHTSRKEFVIKQDTPEEYARKKIFYEPIMESLNIN